MMRENIEALYGLSPLQQGILFHTLLAPGTAQYFEQFSFPIEGELDLEAFEGAWRRVMERHPILRTAFVWEGLDQPRQVVHRKLDLPFHFEDGSDWPEAERGQRLDALRRRDRGRGFHLARAPLMRVILVRLDSGLHELIWSHHHLLLDGWSVSLVIGEVFAFYRALSRGERFEPPTPRPFRDFIRWIDGRNGGSAEAFFRDRFADRPPTPVLVDSDETDGGEAEAGDLGAGDLGEYGRLGRALGEDATARLRALAPRHGLTLNTLVQGAWALLLARHAGSLDVVFGVTSAGRPAELDGVEAMVGMFINTLPLRVRGGWQDALAPWLLGLQDENAELREHEHSSLVDIQTWSGAERGRPLFDTILAFENYPVDERLSTGDVGVRIPELSEIWERTNYPITVQVLPDTRLHLTLLYDLDRLADGEVQRLLGHLLNLLEGMAQSLDVPLGSLPLLGAGERQQLLVEWQPAVAPLTQRSTPTLHQRFAQRAEERPEAPAVTFEGSSLGYGELLARSNRLAHHLVALGVTPETRVAICLDRSPELVVAILGVLAAGGVYVPLDPAYPDERLAYLVADSQAALVLITSDHGSRLAALGTETGVVELDTEAETLAARPASNPAVPCHPEQLAYVIYTSGTTGRPKGVGVSHHNVLRLFDATPEFDFRPDDVWTLFHSYAFDFSVWELWGALLFGGRLVVVPHLVSRSPERFLDLLAGEGVTVLNQTPSAFRQLVAALPGTGAAADGGDPEANGDSEADGDAPWALRWIVFGGEAKDPASIKAWFERFGDQRPGLVDMYGITETTVHVTFERLRARDFASARGRNSIGRPLADLSLHLLDDGGRPVPLGRRGEIFVGGGGVARGYLGRPGLTAERFVPDPFASAPGARLYRALDVGRRLDDGSLAYLGRGDRQIKVRGFRIEPGEIEAVLDGHPAVASSRVDRLDHQGEASLVAHVVYRPEGLEPGGQDETPTDDGAQVERWREVFDETYEHSAAEDPTFDIGGWNRSSDGAPLPAAEMAEWVETTVGRILAFEPEQLLEIGCGTGLLLYRVAPEVERYVATDLSRRAIAELERQLPARGLDHVKLVHAPADRLEALADGDEGRAAFDTVVINSVAQYFPGPDYLEAVVRTALDHLAPGGRILVGDLRSLELLDAFHTEVVLAQSAPEVGLAALERRIQARRAQDEELVLSPRWFGDLVRREPRLAEVEVQVRRGRAENELTRYRYDVVLHATPTETIQSSEAPQWIDLAGIDADGSPTEDAADLADLAGLEARLAAGDTKSVLALRGVGNARLGRITAARRRIESASAGGSTGTAGELQRPVEAGDAPGTFHPEDLYQLGERLGWQADVGWDLRRGAPADSLEVVFWRGAPSHRSSRGDDAQASTPNATAPTTNQPALGTALRALVPELRQRASDALPGHMVPSAIVLVDRFPLTAHGKLDTTALPPPDDLRPIGEVSSTRPRSEIEETLATIWGEVLGVARVGVDDSFFDLGGHSLLATRLIAKVRARFGSGVGLRDLFEAPTVAGLAAAIALDRGRKAEAGAGRLPQLVPDPAGRHEPFPLTDVQQAYWVGRRSDVELGGVSAHVYLELDGSGALDLERLEEVWNQLIARHDMLRAVVGEDGQQRVLESVPRYRFERLDLRETPQDETDRQLEAVRERMSHQVLPADRWPLFEIRASLLSEGRHRLHISLDVLLFDGWSFRLLGAEVEQLYRQPESQLEPLGLTFRDYVLAEVALRDSDLYRSALDYWRGRLDTLPAAPELPLARDPATISEHRFERFSGTLDEARWQDFERRAQSRGLTSSAALLAVFAEILARWSKAPRFTLDLTLFRRLPFHPQVDRLLGDFTALTLLEVDHRGRRPFGERARRIQEQLWRDLDHHLVGGVRVLRELAARRGRAGVETPIVFTSTLNLDAGGDDDEAAGVPVEVGYSIGQTPQVWLDHQVYADDGSLTYNWDTVEGLFPVGMTAAMFGAYRGLLERLARHDEAWDTLVTDLLPVEQRELLAQRNETATAIPEGLLHQPLAERVREDAGRPAVITTDFVLTYGELDRLADHYARVLRHRGARRNALVAVAMDKGWEQVVAVYAILRSGAAYLPVAPDLPAERFAHLLDRGEVALALTQESLLESLPWPGGVTPLAVVDTVKDGAVEASSSAEPLEAFQKPGDLAYVIFTSGSTGEPKGVMIDHRGALNTVIDVDRRFDVGPDDRVLALSSLSFDLSVWDVFGVLATGGALVMPEPWAARDPSHWLERMVREKVTLWNTVPALLEMLVEYAEGRGATLPDGLRLAMLSGDWIPLSLPDRARTLCPGLDVVSLGGATEASIWSILFPVAEVDPGWSSIPYGRPMDNQTFHVLGDDLEPRPVGVPGELYIGGIGVALGYWRDEERTAAAFLDHPTTGERLYRTGDLGRNLADGVIEFLGREDGQVKIQGHRIEVGEIEATLVQHPAVDSAVVAAVGGRHDRRLVAYVVPSTGDATASGDTATTEGGDATPEAPSVPGGDPGESLAALEHKLGQPGLRHDLDISETTVPLPAAAWPEDRRPGAAGERRSRRRFAAQPVALESLGTLLAQLTQIHLEGEPLPRYRYGSAGSLYPVRAYLWVRPGAVEGLEAGAYYHDPVSHRLVLLSPAAAVADGDRPVDPAGISGTAFDLYLVADLAAIEPVYGERGRHYAILEAGLMTQLLEMTAPDAGLGLCQIGEVAFDALSPAFRLPESAELVHSLVGGVPSRDGAEGDAPEVDVAELTTTLEQYLEGRLPRPMVPRAWVRLAALPLTANGKVDRAALARDSRALAGGDLGRGGGRGTAVPARGRLEEEVAEIVRGLLGIEQLGVTDSFFELGGSSVHLVQAHAKLRQRTGVDLPLIEMFNHPTVRQLATFLGQQLDAVGRTLDDPPPAVPGVPAAPSPAEATPASTESAEAEEPAGAADESGSGSPDDAGNDRNALRQRRRARRQRRLDDDGGDA